jgi:large subunit ribosomal protein L20
MPRIKRGTHRIKRRKNILARTAYVGRKLKKRDNRALQQTRLNAALREMGLTYSKTMGALKKKGIELDRKVLSQIASKYPKVFAKITA